MTKVPTQIKPHTCNSNAFNEYPLTHSLPALYKWRALGYIPRPLSSSLTTESMGRQDGNTLKMGVRDKMM